MKVKRDTEQFAGRLSDENLRRDSLPNNFAANCPSPLANWVSANCLSASCPVSGFCSCETFKID